MSKQITTIIELKVPSQLDDLDNGPMKSTLIDCQEFSNP